MDVLWFVEKSSITTFYRTTIIYCWSSLVYWINTILTSTTPHGHTFHITASAHDQPNVARRKRVHVAFRSTTTARLFHVTSTGDNNLLNKVFIYNLSMKLNNNIVVIVLSISTLKILIKCLSLVTE